MRTLRNCPQVTNAIAAYAGLLWIFVALATGDAISSSNEEREQEAQLIHNLLEAYASNHQFSGTALVAQGDEIVYHGSWGYANHAYGVLNTNDTRYRIASITKAFTATAVMLLVEDERIQLDDTIGMYLPDLRDDIGERVTIEQLLTHSSGLHWLSPVETSDGDFGGGYPTTRSLIAWISENVGFIEEPGTVGTYSNAGYVLLAGLIESVTGQTLEDVIQERICTPAGLKSTTFESALGIDDGLATGYRCRAGKYFYGGYVDMRLARGNGGLIATAEDIYRFARAFQSGRLVDDETAKRMLTPVSNRWGFAWTIRNEPDGYPPGTGRLVVHRGSNGFGFKSQLVLSLDADWTIVLLTNLDQCPRWEIAQRVSAVLHGEEPALPEPSPLPTLVSELDRGLSPSAVGALPGWERELTQLSLFRIRSGDDHGAMRVLDWLTQAYPDSVNAKIARAYAHATFGRRDQAITICQPILRREPYHEEVINVYQTLGETFVQPLPESLVMRALINTGSAAALEIEDRLSADRLLLLGYRLHSFGMGHEAIETFTYWVAIEPESWQAHAHRGALLFAHGQLENAEAAYLRSLEINPENDDARAKLDDIRASSFDD